MADERRKLYLVCYDIADSRRLVKTHRAIKRYAVDGQKSLYECLLTSSELRDLEVWLTAHIKPEEDRIFIFGLSSFDQVQYFGRASRPICFPFIVS